MKHKISPVDFSLLCKAGQQRLIVDVRTPAEVAGESLPGSHHIPLQDLTIDRIQQWLQASGGDQEEPVYLLCASGVRAEKAAALFAETVDNPLWIIEGGISALRDTELPLQRGERAVMSLERQVRITAGLLVVVGVVLGTWVAPAFYALSAFVGAGLTFAGITDSCAMAIVLAKMPWNQRG